MAFHVQRTPEQVEIALLADAQRLVHRQFVRLVERAEPAIVETVGHEMRPRAEHEAFFRSLQPTASETPVGDEGLRL